MIPPCVPSPSVTLELPTVTPNLPRVGSRPHPPTLPPPPPRMTAALSRPNSPTHAVGYLMSRSRSRDDHDTESSRDWSNADDLDDGDDGESDVEVGEVIS